MGAALRGTQGNLMCLFSFKVSSSMGCSLYAVDPFFANAATTISNWQLGGGAQTGAGA